MSNQHRAVAPSHNGGEGGLSEGRATFIAGAVFLINVLDFMIVMPLGPFFAPALGIPESQLGWVGGSYTFAAAIAGLGASVFLDRIRRRTALALTLGGLTLSTFACAFAWNFPSLIAARVLAGAFGGPAAGVAIALLSDAVPPNRRGRAMGRAMMAFSIAAVLGVPAGLFLADFGGWRAPFIAVAGLGVVAGLFSVASMRGEPVRHDSSGVPGPRAWALLKDPLAILALACSSLIMFSGFSVIPNIPIFLVQNVGVPKGSLGALYAAGGAVSVVTLLTVGPLVDRLGAVRIAIVGTAIFLATLFAMFGTESPLVAPWVIFVFFMMGMGVRNITNQAMGSKVPPPAVRAGFQSLNNAAQHLASGLGAVASTRLLHTGEGGRLVGLGKVAILSAIAAALYPVFAGILERRLKHRGEH
jgi:predicted MFS family arabinose efflux permease